MKRVGVLQNGIAHGTEERMTTIPPSQRLRVYRHDEVPHSATTADQTVGAPLFLAPHRTSTDRTAVGKDEGYATGVGSGESVGSDSEEAKSEE